jgi:phosphoribosylamine-glycine ligase
MSFAGSDHSETRALVLGVGAFAQAALRVFRDAGARGAAYLTRDYGHAGPLSVGACVDHRAVPNPCGWIREFAPDLILPMSIEWALKPWTAEFLATKPPLLCPTGEALQLERDRDFSRELCARHGVPFARSFFVANRAEAERKIRETQRPYVIKNPLCSPSSPIHTIVCETAAETLAWLQRVDDSEGIFLQEYLGRREAGHIALVSGGQLQSLVTNQEYKRAYSGNMGLVAGAPLGGLVQQDCEDQFGLAKALLHPLRPWFEAVDYRGPVQVTAMWHEDRWHVLEYNVRLGVTSGPLILRMLENPMETMLACVRGEPIRPRWRAGAVGGCNLTLAGWGYPYTQLTGPKTPILIDGDFSCDVWWQEVEGRVPDGLEATGHRLCDVAAIGATIPEAIDLAYRNIRRIHSLASYYRTDVGQSLWPPGAP